MSYGLRNKSDFNIYKYLSSLNYSSGFELEFSVLVPVFDLSL